MVRTFVLLAVLVAVVVSFDHGPGIGKNFLDNSGEAIDAFRARLYEDERAFIKDLLKGENFKKEMLSEIQNKKPDLYAKVEVLKDALDGYFASKQITPAVIAYLKDLYLVNIFTALSVLGGRDLTHKDYVNGAKDFVTKYEALSVDDRANLNYRIGFDEWYILMKKQAAS